MGCVALFLPRSLSALSQMRWFRFAFSTLRLALGLLALVAVAWRQVVVFSVCVGFSNVR